MRQRLSCPLAVLLLRLLSALPGALDAAGVADDWQPLVRTRANIALKKNVIDVGARGAVFSAGRIEPQGPDWDHIGMAEVDFRGDHDVIRAAGQGRFRSIRIVVEGGDIQMFNVRITFGNGQTFSPRTRLSFDQHSRSREIDLPGATRVIRRIDFSYRSVRGGRWSRATVHVYGRR